MDDALWRGASGFAPPRWTVTGDAVIDTTAVTTNGIVFTGSLNGHLQ